VLGSVSLHCTICYVSFFEGVFGTVALSRNDWILVFVFTFPILIVGEVLKIFARRRTRRDVEERTRLMKK